MEAPEVPTEHLQEHIEHEAHGGPPWVMGVALSSAIIAALAAVASLLAGANANEAMIDQMKAADQWNYYQAKGVKANVLPLMSMLCDTGYAVLLETSGAHDISKVDPRVHRIMDLKTPGSGEVNRNLWSNIEHLTLGDEVKFVMGSREDYEWSRDKVQRYDLPSRCHTVLFSPIFGRIDPRQIVEWILADKLSVRFQLQMHKFIWSPTQRGV